MTERDVPAVAALHASELAASFLGRLGVGFLTRLYGFMRSDPAFMCWVVASGGDLTGYLAATDDTDGFYRRTYLRHFAPLAGSVLRRALTRPALAWEAAGVLMGSTPDTRPPGDRAELLSIAVRESGRGAGTGKALVSALRAELARRGAKTCSVVVEEGIAAHHFYRAVGFVERRTFRLHGAPCSFYVLSFDGSGPPVPEANAAPRARDTSASTTTTTSSSK